MTRSFEEFLAERQAAREAEAAWRVVWVKATHDSGWRGYLGRLGKTEKRAWAAPAFDGNAAWRWGAWDRGPQEPLGTARSLLAARTAAEDWLRGLP